MRQTDVLPLMYRGEEFCIFNLFLGTQFQVVIYAQITSIKKDKFLRINIQEQILYFEEVSKLSVPLLQTKYITNI